jgi:hypothetical protein
MRHPARLGALILTSAALAVGLTVGIDGWPGGGEPSLLIGFPDCEAPVGGLIAQPTAAWSSFTFVVAGIWIAGDRRVISLPTRLLFASVIGAVGLGSFFGHAALTDWARQLDSLAIKLMLVTFIVVSFGGLRSWEHRASLSLWAGLAASTIALQLAWPAVSEPLLAALVVTAVTLVGLSAAPETRRRLVIGLMLLGAGAVAWWVGRRGGPLCAPGARFQLHGLWHILAAAGIAAAYQIYRSETT